MLFNMLSFLLRSQTADFAKKILILGRFFIFLCFVGGTMCELIFCTPLLHRLSSQAKLKRNKELSLLRVLRVIFQRVNLVFIIWSLNSLTENDILLFL